MAESIHDKLKRVRKPRVHITYEVETEGAMIERELPFVMGVLGDFSGDPAEPLEPLEKRKFVQIDRDNFNEVMARMKPGLNLRVENTIQGDGTEIPVGIRIRDMKDFEPAEIARQVPVLRKLMETRDKLRDLSTKVDRSSPLENVLGIVLENSDNVQKLSEELRPGSPNSPDEEDK